MKVSQFMNKNIITVGTNTPIKKVVQTIFNLRIGAVPVVKGKNLIGLVTRDDILSKLHPSIQEYMQDFKARDFEQMEHRLSQIISQPVSQIMISSVKSVYPNTPLMHAESIMLLNDYYYLPVVNEKNELVGIISHGDIFRALVGTEIPYETEEEFNNWLSGHYDLVVKWELRLKEELKSLVSIFKKYKVKRVLDVGCATGEHPIALAEKGFYAVGLSRSDMMIRTCFRKYSKLSEKVKSRLEFHKGYNRILTGRPREFDCCIIMGNSLALYPLDYKLILEKVSKSLVKKNALLILQLTNFEKILKVNNRFLNVSFAPSKLAENREFAFLEFYDKPKKAGGNLTLNMSICTFDGQRWMQSGMNSTPVANIKAENIKPVLKKLGFKKIEFYGSNFYQPLFKEKFDIKKHDWLTVVALR